jgi:GT2 family glycosyltransferase
MRAYHSARSSRTAFAPRRVVELNLEIGRPLPTLEDLGDYRSLLGIVKLHGVTLGYIDAPVVQGRCSGRTLTEITLRRHEDAIVRHLLYDALVDGTFARQLPLTAAARPCIGADSPSRLSLTVAVCTRNRTKDLARCLASLERLDYPLLDVVVVDNAPTDSQTEHLVRSRHPGMRYICERTPGTSWARNRAVSDSTSELLAYIDDDVVVDPAWARAVVRLFDENPDVMAVTGLVAPYEIETPAQQWFEDHGGFSRGFERRWLRRQQGKSAATLGNTGTFGTGANCAFRRSIFRDVGPFDPALGGGTVAEGGEDLDIFFRVLRAGGTLVYEPAAMARHRHRLDEDGLRDQLTGWGLGMHAYLGRSMRAYPETRLGLAGLRAGQLLLYHPRRVAESLVSSSLHFKLTLAEWQGAMAGVRRYGASQQRAHEIAAKHGKPVIGDSVKQARPPERSLRPLRRVRLDLLEPLPAVVPGPDDSDCVRIRVDYGKRRLGTMTIVSGGHPISRARLGDAIVSGLGITLLDEIRDPVRAALRAAWKIPAVR